MKQPTGSGGLFRRHYPELDLVRAAAITLVLMRHFSDLFMRGEEGAVVHLFAWGWHGVDLFFALSGFLIGGQIIEELRAGSFSFKRFFLKRTFRIIPPYLFAIAVFVAYFSFKSGFLVLRDGEVLKDVAVHVLYLQDYIHYAKTMYNGIYWSLAVEEKFYIALPLIAFFVYSVWRARKGRALFAVLGALALLAVAMRFASYEPGADFWSAYLAPFHLRFDNLLYGVLAAFAFIHFRERLASAGWCLLALAAAGLGASFAFGGLSTSYFNVCWQFTLTGAGFSALLLWMVSVDAGRFLPFKRAVSAVSRYSYAMYLYHLLILGLTQHWLRALIKGLGGGAPAALMVFVVYFAAVTLASMAAYALIDRPFMNLRKRVVGEGERAA